MGKYTNSSKLSPLIKSQLVMFEKQLGDSHLDGKPFEENAAMTKIQVDPNYNFRYVKKFDICKTYIGALMNSSTNSLSNNKQEL